MSVEGHILRFEARQAGKLLLCWKVKWNVAPARSA